MNDGNTHVAANLDEIESVPGITILASFGDGKHYAMVPVKQIQMGRPFTSNRGADPKDVELLKTTAASSHLKGKPGFINPPVVFFRRDLSTGVVAPWAVEGHQRLRVIRQSGVEMVIVCFVLWSNDKEALEAGAAMNWGRYKVGDETIFSMLVEGVLMQKQIADTTGASETKISRMAKMAGYDYLVDLVNMGAITHTEGSKLVDAATEVDDDREKEQNIQKNLDLLESTITYHRKRAKTKAKTAQAKINKNPNRKWGKYKQHAKESFHLKNDVDWKKLVDALKGGSTRSISGGGVILDATDLQKSSSPVTFGDEEEWKTRFAFDNIEGREFTNMDKDDLETVLENWRWAGEMIQAAYDLKIREEERKNIKYPERYSRQVENDPMDVENQDPNDMEVDEDE